MWYYNLSCRPIKSSRILYNTQSMDSTRGAGLHPAGQFTCFTTICFTQSQIISWHQAFNIFKNIYRIYKTSDIFLQLIADDIYNPSKY